MAQTSPQRFPPGYRAIEEIGRGGSGIVWKAFQEATKAEVAIKLLQPQLLSDEASRRRFMNEATAAARLKHPRLLQVLECGESEAGPFVVTEFASGGTLAALLSQEGSLSIDHGIRLMIEALEGLRCLHEAGVIHRDVKPDNIFLDGKGHAKLGDYGLAAAAWIEGMTSTGVIVGTPHYLAPEVLEGREATVLSDIYSAGATLFEMLEGRPPFEGAGSFGEMLTAGLHKTAPVLTQHENDYRFKALKRFICDLLAKEPRQRPSSVKAVLRELRGIGRASISASHRTLQLTGSRPRIRRTISLSDSQSRSISAVRTASARDEKTWVVVGAGAALLAVSMFAFWATMSPEEGDAVSYQARLQVVGAGLRSRKPRLAYERLRSLRLRFRTSHAVVAAAEIKVSGRILVARDEAPTRVHALSFDVPWDQPLEKASLEVSLPKLEDKRERIRLRLPKAPSTVLEGWVAAVEKGRPAGLVFRFHEANKKGVAATKPLGERYRRAMEQERLHTAWERARPFVAEALADVTLSEERRRRLFNALQRTALLDAYAEAGPRGIVIGARAVRFGSAADAPAEVSLRTLMRRGASGSSSILAPLCFNSPAQASFRAEDFPAAQSAVNIFETVGTGIAGRRLKTMRTEQSSSFTIGEDAVAARMRLYVVLEPMGLPKDLCFEVSLAQNDGKPWTLYMIFPEGYAAPRDALYRQPLWVELPPKALAPGRYRCHVTLKRLYDGGSLHAGLRSLFLYAVNQP